MRRWKNASRSGPPLPADKNLPVDGTAAARQQAVEALGASDLADELVARLLAGAVKDPAPGVRLAALKALAHGNRNARPALPGLAAALKDESPAVREWSARVLGQIGPPAKPAIPRLTQLTRDENAPVRAAAQEALAAINRGGVTNAPPPPR